MNDDALQMKEAFLEAYPRYVVRILNERGIELTELVADAIVDGSSILDGLLQRLVDTPWVGQRHSPLELFRESLRPIDRALTLSGVPVPAIDEAHRSLHSWDVYALCPGSSHALGPSAHDAHLRWGIGKAMAVGAITRRVAPDRPAVALLCRDGDREHLGVALLDAGYRAVGDVEDGAVLALVDVDVNADLVSEMVGFGIRVVAYGDQITDISTVGLKAAGVWKVIPRSAVLNSINSIVPVVG